MPCEFCQPLYGDPYVNWPVGEPFACPYCKTEHAAVDAQTQLCESARARLTAILAASLTPATLAAVIFDLDSNDQPDDRDAPIADRVKGSLRRQLDCMVGEAEAQRMIEVEAIPHGLSR
jgi:hypothetical protein